MLGNVKAIKDRPRRDTKPWPLLRFLSRLRPSPAPTRSGLAATLKRPAPAPAPGNATWQSELATTYEMIADELMRRGKTVEALEPYQRSYAILDELADRDPEDRDLRLALVTSNWKLASLGDNASGRMADVVSGPRKLERDNMLTREQLEWLPSS